MTSEGCNEWGVLLAEDQEHSCLSHQGGGGGGCHKQLVELVCSQGEGITNLSREKVDEVLREKVDKVLREMVVGVMM